MHVVDRFSDARSIAPHLLEADLAAETAQPPPEIRRRDEVIEK
jgi:hypothetical protein